MRIRSGLPLGVNAAFFEEARRVRALERLLSGQLEDAGFHEVLLPILDYYEPYQTLLSESFRSGRDSDQLYRFVDRDGQLLALRYDFTPLLARLVAPRLASWDLPVRFFYRGDVVRYQEPGPGRLRESAQLGAEIIDQPGASNEREALELFVRLLLGSLEDTGRSLDVVLGLAGALDELVDRAPDRTAALTALEHRDRAASARAGAELLQVVVDGVPEDPDVLGAPADDLRRLLEQRRELVELLAGEGVGPERVRVSVDLAEFANFGDEGREGEHPYYEGLVFRAYLDGSAQPVGNGGRYDGLFKVLDADVSATGFSLGLDQLLEASS